MDRPVRPWLILICLTLAGMLSYIDRYLLAIMLQPIKTEMKLSDTQVGLLTGLAFSLFYGIMGVVIARLADRGFRRIVIVVSVTFWSVMTALTGFVRNAPELALARFGVGLGEAGLTPSAQSLLVDVFPERLRSTVIGIFIAGAYVGLLLALVGGSQLEARYGWRSVFMIMLFPGLVLAALIWFTTPEIPTSASTDGPARAGAWRPLLQSPVYRHMPFITSSFSILSFAQTQWLPAFVERSFHVSRVELGINLALTKGLAALIGVVVGGILADKVAARGPIWTVRFCIASLALAVLPAMLLYLSQDVRWVYVLSALMGFFISVPHAPFWHIIHRTIERDLRATAVAITAMVGSIIGLGMGPFVIGALSDYFMPTEGQESLRYALLITVNGALAWGLWHLFCVHRLMTRAGLGALQRQ